MSMDPASTALLLCDMQNGFLHPEGSYARGGSASPDFAPLVPRLKAVRDAVRHAGGWIASTHFTIPTGKNGEPFISDHMKRLRPFLKKGDFEPGGFDARLVDELAPSDLAVEKVAFSAFYMSRLEYVLRRAGVTTLLLGGVVTNGGVASTLRDAHVRDFHTILLDDGCAAFKPDVHEATLKSLSSITQVMTCAEAAALFR